MGLFRRGGSENKSRVDRFLDNLEQRANRVIDKWKQSGTDLVTDAERAAERQSKKFNRSLLRTGLILIGVGAATQVGVHYLNRKIDQRMGTGHPAKTG